MNTTDAGAPTGADGAPEEQEASAPRGAVVALGARAGASALALVAGVGVVASRAWLGGRTPWVLGLAAAGVAITSVAASSDPSVRSSTRTSLPRRLCATKHA